VLIDSVRLALASRADPVRAAGTQAYMKSAMPYYGVRMPDIRLALRPIIDDVALPTFADWLDTIRALWDEASYREERYAALEVLGARRYQMFLNLDALALLEYLIVTGAWWDLVDDIAAHRVGALFRRFPADMRPVLLAWSIGADHWLRRTSIICQIGLRSHTDTELLFTCIEPSLGERDFFLRKAIGWALREYSKTAPDAVRAYVTEHASQLSALSRKEALRRL
jgi:3-methyladenine DNA glycosylase AlkD